MINHIEFDSTGFAGKKQLAHLIKESSIQFAGNRNLKIYGTLSCTSGKRMKTVNRVFFNS